MLYVVTGPPAGGKSTWVRGHAQAGDVVVDYDLIAGALSAPGDDGATPHGHRGAVRDVAFRARSAAIHEALRHAGKVDVYIIHSLPPAEALAKYAENHAKIVVVDPGRDVVMQRIAEQRPRTARAVAARWYSQTGQGGRRTPASASPTPAPHPTYPQCTPPPATSRTW